MKKRAKRTAPKTRAAQRGHKSPPAMRQSFPGAKLHVVFNEKKIQKRVGELAAAINRDFEGKTVHVIGILENCFLFMSDLVRSLKMPVVCHFLKAETKDDTSGKVAIRNIVYTPRVDVAGKDVLLVDGILQSGVTIDHLVRVMQVQQAKSVNVAELIEKTDELKVDVVTKYVGFKTQKKFLVGYGLGYQEMYRNLPYVATVG